MASRKHLITIAITTAALSIGGIGLASASNSKSVAKSKFVASKTTPNPMTAIVAGRMGNPGGDLATVLSGLVAKGTLTQAQVDAINAAIAAAHASAKPPVNPMRAAEETLIASTIGIDVATLETRLKAGDSLATIAGSKTPALIAALVADATKKIDAAVTAGQISAARATTLKTNLTAQVTAVVNRAGGKIGGMMGGRGFGGRGMGHMDNDAPGMMGGLTPPPVQG
ncbi:MAG: hypothetical protein WCK72_06550 [Actinomycetes bacterium]